MNQFDKPKLRPSSWLEEGTAITNILEVQILFDGPIKKGHD